MIKRLGEILIENNELTEADLQKALAFQRETKSRTPIGEILVEMKIITLDTLIKYLEIQLRQRFE
jgi:hypothetical protein